MYQQSKLSKQGFNLGFESRVRILGLGLGLGPEFGSWVRVRLKLCVEFACIRRAWLVSSSYSGFLAQ